MGSSRRAGEAGGWAVCGLPERVSPGVGTLWVAAMAPEEARRGGGAAKGGSGARARGGCNDATASR